MPCPGHLLFSHQIPGGCFSGSHSETQFSQTFNTFESIDPGHLVRRILLWRIDLISEGLYDQRNIAVDGPNLILGTSQMGRPQNADFRFEDAVIGLEAPVVTIQSYRERSIALNDSGVAEHIIRGFKVTETLERPLNRPVPSGMGGPWSIGLLKKSLVRSLHR